MRRRGQLGAHARLSRLLPAWPGRRAGGGRPGGRGGKERSRPGRRGFVSFVPRGGSAAAGGAGSGRSFPPLGLRVTAAAPPDPPPGVQGGGREVAARRSRARSGRRPPRRAHPAGPGPVVSAGPGAGAVGTRRCGAPWGEGPEASTPRGRGSPGEWWAASVLRVGTTLLRAKEKSGGSACNAIGRRRRWSRSSAPPPRRRSLRRSRPAPSPPSQDPRRGPFPASPERREVARGRADWEVEASSCAVTTDLTDCAGGGLSLLPRSPRGRLPSPCSDCPWVLAGAG